MSKGDSLFCRDMTVQGAGCRAWKVAPCGGQDALQEGRGPCGAERMSRVAAEAGLGCRWAPRALWPCRQCVERLPLLFKMDFKGGQEDGAERTDRRLSE